LLVPPAAPSPRCIVQVNGVSPASGAYGGLAAFMAFLCALFAVVWLAVVGANMYAASRRQPISVAGSGTTALALTPDAGARSGVRAAAATVAREPAVPSVADAGPRAPASATLPATAPPLTSNLPFTPADRHLVTVNPLFVRVHSTVAL
jgi:hypothetical protein